MTNHGLGHTGPRPLAGMSLDRDRFGAKIREIRKAAAEQRRFEVDAVGFNGAPADLCLRCVRCRTWWVDIDEPIELADLNARAAEHAEVCP